MTVQHPNMTSSVVSCMKKQRALVVLHFISMAFLYLPCGVGWYFGNLVVYINSYLYASMDIDGFNTQWVISTFVVAWSLALIIGGRIIRRVDHRLITLFGVLFFDAGMFLGGVSVEQSQFAFISTYAILSGIGLGFIQVEVLTRIPALVSKRTGIAFAVLNNCFNVGAIFFQWVATWYVNPKDKDANILVFRKFKVFSDRYVVDHVPNMFIVLGIITSSLHLSGFIFTCLLGHRGLIHKVKGAHAEIKDREVGESTSLKRDSIAGKKNNQTFDSSTDSEKVKSFRNVCESSSEEFKVNSENNKGTDTGQSNKKQTDSKTDKSTPDMDSFQMLKTLRFYVLWYSMLSNDVVYIVLLNYYKVYGQLYIPDDHFLTYLGMVSLLTVLFARFILAWLVDTFTIKTTNIAMFSVITCAFVVFYFSPQINSWLFAVCTCLITGLCSGVYLVFPVTVLRLFGRTHFAANYGILITCTIVLNTIAPVTLDVVLYHTGWAGLFLGTAGVASLALLVNFLGIPNEN